MSLTFPRRVRTLALLLCVSACQTARYPLDERRLPVPFHVNGPAPPPRAEQTPKEEAVVEDELGPPPQIGGEERLSFELRGMPLGQAVHLIASAADLNVYLDGDLGQTVDASFPNVTLNDALHSILARNDMRLVEDPPGVYWVTSNDGSEEETGAFTVESIDAGEVLQNLTTLVSSDTRVVVDADRNFIMVRGPRSEVELVERYLERVDELKQQVLVELKVVEVSINDEFDFGLALDMTGADVGSNNLFTLLTELSSPRSAFTFAFENATVPLTATLDALDELISVHLVSSPRVLVTTGSEANVSVVTEVPFIQATTSTDVSTGGVGTSSIEEVQFKEVGVSLKVTPEIQEDGIVQVLMDQQLSEVVDVFLSVPVISTRNMASQFQVEDGHTVVLGGLLQNRTSETDTGVPGLRHIPWLGRLFRAESDFTERRELLLFLTVHVLDPDRAAGLAAQYEADYFERIEAAGLATGAIDPTVVSTPELEAAAGATESDSGPGAE